MTTDQTLEYHRLRGKLSVQYGLALISFVSFPVFGFLLIDALTHGGTIMMYTVPACMVAVTGWFLLDMAMTVAKILTLRP